MKLETRGKYPGVKVHLEPDECEIFTACAKSADAGEFVPITAHRKLTVEIGRKIIKLQEKEPTLLSERTPEQIAAILAKEVEAATLKLQRMKDGKDWKKINPDKLQEALNKHVKKD
jgi:hypothetical protein